MCNYCEEEKRKVKEAGESEPYYGIICPQKAAKLIGEIIGKRINGEPMTKNQAKLFDLTCKLFDPSLNGVKLSDIPKGGMFTKGFINAK